MKVDISIEKDEKFKVGFFKNYTVFVVRAKVQLTNEEKEQINKLGLSTYRMFSYPIHSADKKGMEIMGDTHYHDTVGEFAKCGSLRGVYEDLNSAHAGVSEMETALRNLKSMLETANTPTKRSFEL